MSVKSVLGVVTGFLGHHIADLDAIGDTLSGVLAALPVNAETRAHLDALITRVKTSAENIGVALEDLSGVDAPEPVTIRESDIEAALRNVLASGALDGPIADAVRAYMVDHAPAVAPSAPVPTDPAAPPPPPPTPGPLVGGEGAGA